MEKSEYHINNHLGALVKRWTITNPEAIRALHKFDTENDQCLTNPQKTKGKKGTRARIRTYTCRNGEILNLDKIAKDCIHQDEGFKGKKVAFKKKGG